ncbi:unnamed protein product [Rhizoctonia solani]|uniref:Uncharacterized protein n=1 Tax=Rhizoctonia solani TaxID=456999 RepID=A0A8H2WSE2_9AGAM|nr:unnamed protein product [Rhizoctonia solani]
MIGSDFENPTGPSQLATLLGFTNLVTYPIHIERISSAVHSEILRPLEVFAASCPRLETLKLNFSFIEYEHSYSPGLLADAFGKSTMPSFHMLHICGDVELQAESLFGTLTTGSNPFGNFLIRDPRIKDLKLGYTGKA